MSYLRFNHVFFGLLALAFISAFVLPARITVSQRIQSNTQGIFTPISWPVYHVTGWMKNKLFPSQMRDYSASKVPRTEMELRSNIEQLQQQNAILMGHVQRLRELEAERAQLGDVRDLCTHFSVAGGDSGARNSLMLSASSFDGLKEGMPVLYPGGIVGRIAGVGVGGARVLLITDVGSRFTCVFARFVANAEGKPEFHVLPGEARLVTGQGDGTMMITNVPEKVAKESDIRLGDWLVLQDDDVEWRKLRNYKVGRVDAIKPSRSPGFVEIMVLPDQPLTALRDVMVMTKEKG